MKTTAKSVKQLESARAGVEAAERKLVEAQQAHEQAFRQALLALFEEYGLALVPAGSEGARIEVVPYSEFNPGDIL